jgi:hypothetical protein
VTGGLHHEAVEAAMLETEQQMWVSSQQMQMGSEELAAHLRHWFLVIGLKYEVLNYLIR